MRAPLIIGLILAWGHLCGQFYIGGGLAYQSGQYPVINSLVEAYNGYRPDQLDALNALSDFTGPTLALGIANNGKAVNLDVGFFNAALDASRLTQNGTIVNTELAIRQTQAALAFGTCPKPGDLFSLGVNIGLLYANTAIELTTNDPAIGDYKQASTDQFHSLALLPAVQAYAGITEFLFIYFKPGYAIDLFNNDSYTTHGLLNPVQSQNDKPEDFSGRFSGLQLQAGLVVTFSVN